MDPNSFKPVKDETVYRVLKQTIEEGIRREYFSKFGEGISSFRLELFSHPFAIALENGYQDVLKLVIQALENLK